MENYGNTFSDTDIFNMLASLHFSVTPKDKQIQITKDITVTNKEEYNTTKKKRQYDKTTFSINGGTFQGKRRFVHQLVKTYIESHPYATFAELEQVFPSKLQGSYGIIRTINNIKTYAKQKREALISEFTKRIGTELVVVKDVTFDSPSGAASFCIGGSANGWIEWKDQNNNKIDIYRKK